MQDFPIVPPLVIKDTPKPRRLASLSQARAYVDEAMRLGRPEPWRELWHRLKSVTSEENASRRSATCANCSPTKICCCRPGECGLVTTGLDPVVHAEHTTNKQQWRSRFLCCASAWIAGSSPAMTN